MSSDTFVVHIYRIRHQRLHLIGKFIFNNAMYWRRKFLPKGFYTLPEWLSYIWNIECEKTFKKSEKVNKTSCENKNMHIWVERLNVHKCDNMKTAFFQLWRSPCYVGNAPLLRGCCFLSIPCMQALYASVSLTNYALNLRVCVLL